MPLTSDSPAPVDLFFWGNIILRDRFPGDLFNIIGVKFVFSQGEILVVGGKKYRAPRAHEFEHLVEQKRIVFGNIKVSVIHACCGIGGWIHHSQIISVFKSEGFFQEIKSIHLNLGVAGRRQFI